MDDKNICIMQVSVEVTFSAFGEQHVISNWLRVSLLWSEVPDLKKCHVCFLHLIGADLARHRQ